MGMLKQNDLIYDDGPITPSTSDIISNWAGERRYEINNYLGNVNAVLTDRKIPTSAGVPTLFEAVVVHTTDYYPFGMVMPHRDFAFDPDGEDYRYAYNGMEQDGEVSGNGNSYTTEFRQYDPRLGRWKSLDPLMAQFPWMSPYVAFDDNPVYYVDPYGLSSSTGGDDNGGDSSVPKQRMEPMRDLNEQGFKIQNLMEMMVKYYKDTSGKRTVDHSDDVGGVELIQRFEKDSGTKTEGFLHGVANRIIDVAEGNSGVPIEMLKQVKERQAQEKDQPLITTIAQIIAPRAFEEIYAKYCEAIGDEYSSGYIHGYALPGNIVDAILVGESLSSGGGTAPTVGSVSDNTVLGIQRSSTLNRLNHIFGKSEHALESLVSRYGSPEGAYNAVQNAANQALKGGKLTPNANGILPSGNLGNIINVGGMDVRLIGGRVENGQVILSSFSRKGL